MSLEVSKASHIVTEEQEEQHRRKIECKARHVCHALLCQPGTDAQARLNCTSAKSSMSKPACKEEAYSMLISSKKDVYFIKECFYANP